MITQKIDDSRIREDCKLRESLFRYNILLINHIS